ncbi:hypothetical protein B0F90DRAFT_1920984, partial [Multifurca ochricompacta]
MCVLLNVSDQLPRRASSRSDRTLDGEGEGFVAAKGPVSLAAGSVLLVLAPSWVMLVPEEVVLQEWVVQECLEGRVQEARFTPGLAVRAGPGRGERDRGYQGVGKGIRLHPYNYASWKDVLEFSAKHAIVTEAYGSLAAITTFPRGPVDSVLARIETRIGGTPAQVGAREGFCRRRHHWETYPI